MSVLDGAIEVRLAELREAIELRRANKLDQVLRMVLDRGEKAMEDVRRISSDIQQDEYQLLTERSAKAEEQIVRTRLLGSIGSFVLLALLILAMIAIERDTAARRVAEAARRDSEEQFRQVFEASPSGILLIDNNLHIRRANPALCRLLGYEAEEIQLLKLSAITAWDSLVNETQVRIDQQWATKSGGTVWVNVNATVIRDSQGHVLFNLALTRGTSLCGRKLMKQFAPCTIRLNFE